MDAGIVAEPKLLRVAYAHCMCVFVRCAPRRTLLGTDRRTGTNRTTQGCGTRPERGRVLHRRCVLCCGFIAFCCYAQRMGSDVQVDLAVRRDALGCQSQVCRRHGETRCDWTPRRSKRRPHQYIRQQICWDCAVPTLTLHGDGHIGGRLLGHGRSVRMCDSFTCVLQISTLRRASLPSKSHVWCITGRFLGREMRIAHFLPE